MITGGDSASRYHNFGTRTVFNGHGHARVPQAANVENKISQAETARADAKGFSLKVIPRIKGKYVSLQRDILAWKSDET